MAVFFGTNGVDNLTWMRPLWMVVRAVNRDQL